MLERESMFFNVLLKLMWLLKLSLDQNSVVVYHKYNDHFKSNIN
jgi:hypothetical protein